MCKIQGCTNHSSQLLFMGFFTYSKLICILKVYSVTGAEGSGVTESESGWDTTD